jgi:hypothetical protein
MRVAITGSTGLIGSALKPHLESLDHEVIRIVRSNPSGNDIMWSPADLRIDDKALDDVDAVVHLAGAGIGDKRWTDAYKRELLESRTKGTTLIAEAIAGATNGPKVLLSAPRSASTAPGATRNSPNSRRRATDSSPTSACSGKRQPQPPRRPEPAWCTCAPASCCRHGVARSRSSSRCSSSASAARWARAAVAELDHDRRRGGGHRPPAHQ